MSKIIKKNIELSDPVVLSGRTVKKRSLVKNLSEEIDLKSLEFTSIIDAEIKVWSKQFDKQIASSKEHNKKKMKQAYDVGYQKGFTDGIEQERADRIKSIETLLSEAKQKSKKAVRGVEIKVIDLAILIAEKMIHKVVTSDSKIVEDIITEVMSQLIGSETVVLKVSSDDFKVIKAKYEHWLDIAGSAKEFRIEIDKRLQAGDCIVETESGIINGVISDRLDILVEELLKVSR